MTVSSRSPTASANRAAAVSFAELAATIHRVCALGPAEGVAPCGHDATLQDSALRTIRSGTRDSLQTLAYRTGVPVNQLAALNPALPRTGLLPFDSLVNLPGEARTADPASRRAAAHAHPHAEQLRANLSDVATATHSRTPELGPGYESLTGLGKVLANQDPRFQAHTPQGRATTALALAIGGTEVYGKGTTGSDYFSRRGGTGNNMLGFGQFNLAYHRRATSTPEKYTQLMGDILTGRKPMPNSASQSDHATNLARAVERGEVQNGDDLRRWMRANRFGGSNWQGIDDGWGRVPGLGDKLVEFMRNG